MLQSHMFKLGYFICQLALLLSLSLVLFLQILIEILHVFVLKTGILNLCVTVSDFLIKDLLLREAFVHDLLFEGSYGPISI